MPPPQVRDPKALGRALWRGGGAAPSPPARARPQVRGPRGFVRGAARPELPERRSRARGGAAALSPLHRPPPVLRGDGPRERRPRAALRGTAAGRPRGRPHVTFSPLAWGPRSPGGSDRERPHGRGVRERDSVSIPGAPCLNRSLKRRAVLVWGLDVRGIAAAFPLCSRCVMLTLGIKVFLCILLTRWK